ncbi:MAG: hypothetical protein OXE78_11285, partial [Gammaproteobacteria bacterium]|nr:hypothetical protein [Gammaproteobacteria bacterium]
QNPTYPLAQCGQSESSWKRILARLGFLFASKSALITLLQAECRNLAFFNDKIGAVNSRGMGLSE